MTPDSFAALAHKAGFDLPPSVLPALASYLAELHRWNRVMNLVGGRTENDIFTLFLDSFHLAPFLERLPLAANPVCLDLGAGAGLPGIPLRTVWQSGTYTLVESREKRALFMQTALARCPLPGTSVFHGRAENLMAQSEPVDLILSRAFMPSETLLPFVRPHLKPGGVLVLMLNSPLSADITVGWTECGLQAYQIKSSKRFLVALSAE